MLKFISKVNQAAQNTSLVIVYTARRYKTTFVSSQINESSSTFQVQPLSNPTSWWFSSVESISFDDETYRSWNQSSISKNQRVRSLSVSQMQSRHFDMRKSRVSRKNFEFFRLQSAIEYNVCWHEIRSNRSNELMFTIEQRQVYYRYDGAVQEISENFSSSTLLIYSFKAPKLEHRYVIAISIKSFPVTCPSPIERYI